MKPLGSPEQIDALKLADVNGTCVDIYAQGMAVADTGVMSLMRFRHVVFRVCVEQIEQESASPSMLLSLLCP